MAQKFYDAADEYLNQKHGKGTSGTTAQNTGAGASQPKADAADQYLQTKRERAQARARVQAIEAAQKQIRENKQNRAYQTQGGKDYVRQYTGGSRNMGRAPIDPMTITPDQAQNLTQEERDTYKAQYDRVNAQKNTPVIPALARETEARMEKPKFSADPEKDSSVYSKALLAMAQKGTAAAVYGDEKGYSQAVEDYNATRQELTDTVRPVYNRLKTELKGTVTEEQWPEIQRLAKLLEQAFTASGDAQGAAFVKNLQQFETANQWNAYQKQSREKAKKSTYDARYAGRQWVTENQTDAGYYIDKIDYALGKHDYVAAKNWMDRMVQAPLTAQERQQATDYLNGIYAMGGALHNGEDATTGSAKRAALNILDYYGRDARQFADMITSDEGKQWTDEVSRAYGIDYDTDAMKDPTAYIAALEEAVYRDNSTAEQNNSEAYSYLIGAEQDYKNRNATTAFFQRASEQTKRASEHETSRAQMDSYIRAQMAYYLLDKLANNVLGIEGNFTSKEALDSETVEYARKALEQYGVQLPELTEDNYRQVLNRAMEEQSRKAKTMGGVLEAQGYDIDAVRQANEYLFDQQFENDRKDSFTKWAKNANAWDKAAASVLSAAEASYLDWILSLSTFSKIASGHGNADDPNNYQPMAPTATTADLITSAVAGEMAPVWAFIYNTGMSIAENTARNLSFGKIGSLINMGLTAAGSSANEILERGGSPDQAAIGGAAAGMIEVLTEKVSIDRLFDKVMKGGQSAREFLYNAVMQAIPEASEEVAADVLNLLVDSVNMGSQSDFNQKKLSYMESGMTEEEALKKTWLEQIKDMAMSGLSGGISGLVSGVAFGSAARIADTRQIRAMEQEAINYARQAEAEGKQEEAAKYWYTAVQYEELLRQRRAEWTGKQTTEQSEEDAEPVSSETEKTGVQPQTEIDWVGTREQPVQTQAAPVSSDTERTGVQPQTEIDWVGNREQPGQVQAVQDTAEAEAQTQAQQQITGRQAAGEAVDGKNEKGGMPDGGMESRQQEAASGLTAEEPDSSKQQISNDNLRRALAQEGEPYAETGTEGITDGGQRDAGLGTGGQAGAVGESTEGQLAGGRAPTDDAHKRIAIASLQTERKSPREIGVQGGGSYKTLRVVEDETLFTSDMQQAVNDARDHGDSIVFFAGKLEVYNKYKQGYTSVDGIRQVDEHGQVRYYIKADSMIRSPGQLYRHEVFHDIVAKNLGLWQEIADYMQEHFTQNQLARMLGGYVRSYDGIYGEDLLAYLEEFMADGYAELQRANVDIRPAKEALENFKPQLVKEREKGQISQAVRDTRGSPVGKYSANEDETGDGLGLNEGLGRVEEKKTTAQTDREYMQAVEAGDMEAAQRMVDEAANRAGYTIKAYHGTTNMETKSTWNEKKGEYDKEYKRFTVFKRQYDGQFGHFFSSNMDNAGGYGSYLYSVYLMLKNPLIIDCKGDNYASISFAGKEMSTNEWAEYAYKSRKYDGVIFNNVSDGVDYGDLMEPTTDYVVFYPNLIKDASPVTYDNNGKVIPLSERFNIMRADIRYSVAEDEEGSSGTEKTKGQQQTEIDWVGNREQPAQTQTAKVSSETEKKGVQTQEKQEAKTEKKTVRKGETKTAGTEKWESDLEKMEGLALEKKQAYADKKTVSQLKGIIKSAEANLRSFTIAKKAGGKSQVLDRMEADARETLTVLKEALEKKKGDLDAKRARQKKVNEEKMAARKQAELQEQTPRQARKELTQDVLNLFSIQAGNRTSMQKVVWDFADKLLRQGTLTQEDRNELFSQMLENGVEIDQPESYYEDIRREISGARIYVSQEVRDEFGDDWESFRKRAWGNRIYLTDSQNDKGVDVLWQELSSMYPGSFDAEETDLRLMLEQTVQLAEEGKAEHISLTEMLKRNEEREGQSVDDQLDAMQERLDGLLDKFAEKAKLELETKRQSTMKLIRQREHYRDMIEREAKKRSERETRNKVMRDIQSLWKKRTKAPPEIKAEIEKTLKNIDTVARSISIRGIEDCQELARQYRQAADDPNFIRSPYVEERLERLKETQLDDMKIEDVAELGKTVCAISQSLQNWNKMLADEKNAKISDIAWKARAEISAADGTKGGAMNKFLSENHLAPRRFLEHLGGWKRGGAMELLAKELEDGELRQLRYLNQAMRIFDKFLEDKSNSKWLKTASGKNSEWIKVSVPDGTGTREFEITPMKRVQLLLHSRNEDNLRHIREGGIDIPDKELYIKGDIEEAYARGKRIKMEPSVVRDIVKDCTEKELEFARLLEKYYNGFSKDHINEVSMQLDGFERAGGDHYCHIKVDKKFLEKNPGQQQDISLENIGSIVNPRTHSGTPIILQDATEALMEHMEQISKYYGLALAIHDFNGVMNYTFHKEGSAFDTSMSEVLQQKWGSGAQEYLDKLKKDLQEPGGKRDQVSELLNKIKGNLAGATLMFNPSVAISQAFSYPAAMQTLGPVPMLYGLQFWKRADKKLIERYTPLLWYRNQGNSTQELGDYIKEQGLEKKLPFLLNWIQKMDTMTVGRIWVAAEYYVSHNTNLEPGTKAEVEAGTDLYYQKVAEIFNRAVLDTQPNYTTFERPPILRSESDLTRAMTMFKTVGITYYNMSYEAVGRLRADARREKQSHTAENKENLKRSRRFFSWTVMGLTAAQIGFVALKAFMKGITFRGKKYQDEDGEYTAESVLSRLGLDLLETTAGSVIGGAELVQVLETAVFSMNDKQYSFYGSEVTAVKFMNDLGESAVKVFTSLANEDYKGGLNAIKGLAQSIAMGFGGVPAQNVETYLLALTRWIAPEWYEKYNNFFDEVEKSDISEENGRFQNAAIRVLMDNRTEGLSDETIEELQRLWNAGEHAALPAAVPNQISMTVDDTEQEIALSAKMKQAYRESWSKTVSSAMEKLMASETYINADDKGKAGLLQRLYEFAGQTAKGAVLEGYETDKWVLTGQALMDAGAPLEDYIEYRYIISGDDVKAEQKYEALEATEWNDEQKGILWRDELASDKQKDAVEEAAKVGLSLGAFYEYACETYGESDSEKLKVLKGKEWSEEQKESVWMNLLADDKQTAKYQNLKDAGLSWSEAVKVMDIGKTTEGMTDEEEAQVQARWDELAEAPTKRLVNSKAFKNASDEMQTAYLDKLNTYAKEIAKSEILKNYEMDTWVKCGKEVIGAGVPLDEYAVYAANCSDKNLKEKCGILNNTGWNQKQKLIAVKYLSDSAYKSASAGAAFNVDISNYLKGISVADTNGNGSITQAEAADFIDTLNIGLEDKAYLWQMLCPSSKSKKNPYSSRYGQMIWEYMNKDED